MDTFATLLVTLELIVLLIIWVGLPLVPAIMIYRYFPETQVFASGSRSCPIRWGMPAGH